MSDEKTLAAPGLVIETPPCSLCGRPTDATADSTFDCTDCGWYWSASDMEAPGQRIDPYEPLCGERKRPFLGRMDVSEKLRGREYVCLLPKDHVADDDAVTRWHRGVSVDGDTYDWCLDWR